ncbi:hypothetical protein BDQ17DRAFT_1435252 [Cyathus striatus]|nr:hypothetical protein BDQ17DRAFT_1435252 [Cyathus striatus]
MPKGQLENPGINTIDAIMEDKSLNGLIGNPKSANETMSKFYNIINNQPCSEGITQEEIDIASGNVSLSDRKAAKFLERLEKKSENIQKAFATQEEHAKGPWDQEQFEQLLASWVITCDQPFEEVEQPEFH